MDAETIVRLVLTYVSVRNRFMTRGGHTAPVHAALREIEALDETQLAALLRQLEESRGN